MKLKIPALLIIFILTINIFPQDNPKLIVGIVVDQMRYDYLTRFKSHYSSDGFNRLTNEGSNFTYAHYNYVPTYTGPGHSSVYTGTTPFYHGIIGNAWYDRKQKKMVNCTEDESVKTVGSDDDEGQSSPKRLLATTITDQLKLATNGKSKVIGISIKDRAAIFPSGHAADAAYWYDHKNGNFITSTFYMNDLPDWVKDFNEKKLPDYYLSKEWDLSLPVSEYIESTKDNVPFEHDVFNEGKTSFPHKFDKIDEKEKYEYLPATPFGNQILIELAKAVLKNENLGKNTVTDFLTISFSSTDYVGHSYGPNSVEVEDTYIKLDKQLAELLKALDNQVGKGNYIVFLTADHAAQINVDFLKNKKIPAGNSFTKQIKDSLKSFVKLEYNNEDIIENISNSQIFLNYEEMKNLGLQRVKIEKNIKEFLRISFPQISFVLIRDDLEKMIAERNSNYLVLNGFNFQRSGDIIFEYQPNHLPYSGAGTSHGSRFNYDTHIPIIFYGWNIPKQTINDPVFIVDIAPTIADLLHITEPNACIGIPLIKSK